jgi:hypothetical protein
MDSISAAVCAPSFARQVARSPRVFTRLQAVNAQFPGTFPRFLPKPFVRKLLFSQDFRRCRENFAFFSIFFRIPCPLFLPNLDCSGDEIAGACRVVSAIDAGLAVRFAPVPREGTKGLPRSSRLGAMVDW